jgi:hypothetical protein
VLFGLVLALVLPALAHADNDWLGIEVPRPMDVGKLSLNVKAGQTENQWWADGYNTYYMIPSPGQGPQFQDLATVDTRLDWQLAKRSVLELDLPTVFSEFSPDSFGVPEYYNVNTPGVAESQGLGDLRLGLREALRDSAQGFNAAWSLALVAPTGLGPFEAPQTLAATGDGRWQALPGIVFGGQSQSWEGWIQVIGRYQFGRQAVSSGQDYLSWGPSGGIAPEEGGIWLGPRYGADSVAGLAWIWYRDADSRIGLALEAKYHWLSPWTIGSETIGLPAEQYFVLTPEMQARFGRYSAIVGWQGQSNWAVDEVLAEYGEILFDVAYTF